MNHLHVGDQAVPPEEMHRYVLRWTSENQPSLFRDGKRVVVGWQLMANIVVEAKPEEANANTA